jgi:hypothetical protein
MDTIEQTADKLEFRSSLSRIVRIVLLIFGLIPLLAPYELLIKPAWNGRISIAMLFFLVISVGAIGVSIFFVSAALFGRSQQFQFDASNRTVYYRFKTAINPFREERYDFSQIEALEIKGNEWDSRPDTYDISMKIRDNREANFGDFRSRQEAEHYLAALEEMIFSANVQR